MGAIFLEIQKKPLDEIDMDTRNNKKKNKPKNKTLRVPRTIPTLAALTAAYVAAQQSSVNPYPEVTAFCALPKGTRKFRCDYSLNGESIYPLWNPVARGHSYTLLGTPGADPTAVDEAGCPLDMTYNERNKCKAHFNIDLKNSTLQRHHNYFPIAQTPHYFAPGFRFPTYNEMVHIKELDPRAPDPVEDPTYWQLFLQNCLENPKTCTAIGSVLALFVGTAAYKNKQNRRANVLERTLRMRQKVQNNQRKFNTKKAFLPKGPKRGGTRKH